MTSGCGPLSTTTDGDFNGDGRDHLAVGVLSEKVYDQTNAGAVNVIFGSSAGLTATNNGFITENDEGIWSEVAMADERFGASLNAADFNNDGRDDLVIGATALTITSTLKDSCTRSRPDIKAAQGSWTFLRNWITSGQRLGIKS